MPLYIDAVTHFISYLSQENSYWKVLEVSLLPGHVKFIVEFMFSKHSQPLRKINKAELRI